MIGEDRVDQFADIRIAEPAVQPVTVVPVAVIRPAVAAQRKGRIGPRVPGPDIEALRIDHAPVIDGRGGIIRLLEILILRIPVAVMHRKKSLLREVGTPAAGKVGQHALRRLRVGEDIRLVRSLVRRGAANFGEVVGLAFRHPFGRRYRFLAVDTVEVRLRPPVPHILVAEDPRLAQGAIGDSYALTQPSCLEGRIIPVESLATPIAARNPEGSYGPANPSGLPAA